jgi:hypothetical protein
VKFYRQFDGIMMRTKPDWRNSQKMAKLTTKARKKIPAKEFGEPAKHAYPMPDKAHAANAKARAAQMVKKGKLSESEKKKIDAKANKKLGGKSK